MRVPFNGIWLALTVPALLLAALGASAAFAMDDGSGTTDNDTSVLPQQDPTSTPEATPEGDGSEGDDATPDKDCPRDGSEGSEGESQGEGSTTGISFRRR